MSFERYGICGGLAAGVEFGLFERWIAKGSGHHEADRKGLSGVLKRPAVKGSHSNSAIAARKGKKRP